LSQRIPINGLTISQELDRRTFVSARRGLGCDFGTISCCEGGLEARVSIVCSQGYNRLMLTIINRLAIVSWLNMMQA
jgi:hypothetical protein